MSGLGGSWLYLGEPRYVHGQDSVQLARLQTVLATIGNGYRGMTGLGRWIYTCVLFEKPPT